MIADRLKNVRPAATIRPPNSLKVAPLFLAALACPVRCIAGPPYVTDDPEPQETELYLFSAGEVQHESFGETGSGVESNDGLLPDLQLSAEVSISAGAEIYRETGDSAGESGMVGLRLAVTCHFGQHLSILGSAGAQFERRQTNFAYYVAFGWRR